MRWDTARLQGLRCSCRKMRRHLLEPRSEQTDPGRETQGKHHCLSTSSAGSRTGSAGKDTKASPATGRVAHRLHITDETTSPVLCLLCLSCFPAITEGRCRINGKWRSGSWRGHLPVARRPLPGDIIQLWSGAARAGAGPSCGVSRGGKGPPGPQHCACCGGGLLRELVPVERDEHSGSNCGCPFPQPFPGNLPARPGANAAPVCVGSAQLYARHC